MSEPTAREIAEKIERYAHQPSRAEILKLARALIEAEEALVEQRREVERLRLVAGIVA